ncbi:hypothetical protein ABIE44_002754 [Marmoricola sp. OAE513]|uniref:hypothetical protein n=1 Tax=Marmoricola sp. OAE513 TaxID=2817894 RepID=UPI001AE884AB
MTAQSNEFNPLAFGRTATSTRRHLVTCPHLVNRTWHVCDQVELAAYEICDWSQDQIDGVGRSHPATMEDAIRELGLPSGNEPIVRDLLKFVTFDEIWLPYSRSYVALGLGGRAVAAFGKSYVWVGGRKTELPNYSETSHAGGKAVTYGETCPVHFIAMPKTGVCDGCS